MKNEGHEQAGKEGLGSKCGGERSEGRGALSGGPCWRGHASPLLTQQQLQGSAWPLLTHASKTATGKSACMSAHY
jgi:hypothetical protein